MTDRVIGLVVAGAAAFLFTVAYAFASNPLFAAFSLGPAPFWSACAAVGAALLGCAAALLARPARPGRIGGRTDPRASP